MTAFDGPVWMIGCGNMGGAILRRWLAAGVDPALVTVVTRSGRGVPAGVRSLSAPPLDETPATLILDRQGRIAAAIRRSTKVEELRPLVEKVAAEEAN